MKYILKHFFIIKLISFLCFFLIINPLRAENVILKALDLSFSIPVILDAFMRTAVGLYEFFVKDNGIIYMSIWGFVIISIFIYIIKMYFPKNWLSLFNISGGGELWDGSIDTKKILDKTLKTTFRAIVASTLLLQIKPTHITNWLINPFLEFGGMYSNAIYNINDKKDSSDLDIECPNSIIEKGWLNKKSCDFIIKPIRSLAKENNKMIEQGFKFLGISILNTFFSPIQGLNFFSLITGILLIFIFASNNIFTSLLVIQALFNFAFQLILYPFKVLFWVIKESDKWLDIFPVFDEIIKSLKQIIITIIACSFIFIINTTMIKSLVNWNNYLFYKSINNLSFGEHSIFWLSSILTFYLMYKIFDITKNHLSAYVGKGGDSLYATVKGDYKNMTKQTTKMFKDILEKIKKNKKK